MGERQPQVGRAHQVARILGHAGEQGPAGRSHHLGDEGALCGAIGLRPPACHREEAGGDLQHLVPVGGLGVAESLPEHVHPLP